MKPALKSITLPTPDLHPDSHCLRIQAPVPRIPVPQGGWRVWVAHVLQRGGLSEPGFSPSKPPFSFFKQLPSVSVLKVLL